MGIQQEIIKGLATELAKRDRDSLCNLVSDLTFEKAYAVLNGYNLSIEEMSVGNKTIGFNVFFDCNYKSICTTIFRTNDGGCEVYEICDVWLNNFTSPIERVMV